MDKYSLDLYISNIICDKIDNSKIILENDELLGTAANISYIITGLYNDKKVIIFVKNNIQMNDYYTNSVLSLFEFYKYWNKLKIIKNINDFEDYEISDFIKLKETFIEDTKIIFAFGGYINFSDNTIEKINKKIISLGLDLHCFFIKLNNNGDFVIND